MVPATLLQWKNAVNRFLPAALLQIMHNGYSAMVRRDRAGNKGKNPVVHRGDHAFTGLEAALILIAFVVVAAVFSYTLLNTGFMVTQQSRNTIFTAVEQTTSTLDLSSEVYGVGEAGSS